MTDIIASNSSGIGIRYTLGAGDHLVVGDGILVQSTNNDAVKGSQNAISISNAGGIVGAVDGVNLGSTGTSTGYQVDNTGLIQGGDDAVSIFGLANTVVNSGVMTGTYGIYLSSGAEDTRSTTTLTNYGTISAVYYGIYQTSSEALVINNSGLILGSTGTAITLGDGDALIFNSGRIIGNINMGEGSDTYDGRDGRVSGNVRGEGGFDSFYAGANIDKFNGGDGQDRVVFTSDAGVHLALDGSFASTGTAAGDIYALIEDVWGSNAGADRLRGDALNNALLGRAGADTLTGVLGNDSLNGGLGRDNMSGGAGDDHFITRSLSHAGDVITDFQGGTAMGDRFDFLQSALAGSGLGLGPVGTLQFRARVDNVAQDANDRFIFRTTDTTLWFDKNGNAAGGLTQIADLQAGAVMVAADIYVFNDVMM